MKRSAQESNIQKQKHTLKAAHSQSCTPIYPKAYREQEAWPQTKENVSNIPLYPICSSKCIAADCMM